MNPSAWPASSGRVEQEAGSAQPARAPARGREPVPGVDGGSERRRGRLVRGEGSLSCVRPLLTGWSDGRGAGRRRVRRRSNGERALEGLEYVSSTSSLEWAGPIFASLGPACQVRRGHLAPAANASQAPHFVLRISLFGTEDLPRKNKGIKKVSFTYM